MGSTYSQTMQASVAVRTRRPVVTSCRESLRPTDSSLMYLLRTSVRESRNGPDAQVIASGNQEVRTVAQGLAGRIHGAVAFSSESTGDLLFHGPPCLFSVLIWDKTIRAWAAV